MLREMKRKMRTRTPILKTRKPRVGVGTRLQKGVMRPAKTRGTMKPLVRGTQVGRMKPMPTPKKGTQAGRLKSLAQKMQVGRMKPKPTRRKAKQLGAMKKKLRGLGTRLQRGVMKPVKRKRKRKKVIKRRKPLARPIG